MEVNEGPHPKCVHEYIAGVVLWGKESWEKKQSEVMVAGVLTGSRRHLSRSWKEEGSRGEEGAFPTREMAGAEVLGGSLIECSRISRKAAVAGAAGAV